MIFKKLLLGLVINHKRQYILNQKHKKVVILTAMKLMPLGTCLVFTKHRAKGQTPFERLFEIFKELITHTSGDFDEAIDWLRELDKEYQLTDENYTIDDFIEDLLQKSYIEPKKKRKWKR